jgi:hypothetical protein
MSTQRALRMLDAALSVQVPNPVAAVLDGEVLRRQAVEGTLNPLLGEVAGASSGHLPVSGAARRPASDADRLARLTGGELDKALTELVKKHVFAVLSLPDSEKFHPGQAFADMGFDSLTSVELRNRLSAATGRRLPATLTFDYPDPDRLIGYLRENIAAASAATTAPAGDGTESAGAVLTRAMDGLEAALAAAAAPGSSPEAAPGIDRAEVARRLKDLLKNWQSHTQTDPVEDTGGLDALSDRELLDVLDEELGEL